MWTPFLSEKVEFLWCLYFFSNEYGVREFFVIGTFFLPCIRYSLTLDIDWNIKILFGYNMVLGLLRFALDPSKWYSEEVHAVYERQSENILTFCSFSKPSNSFQNSF